MSIQTNDHTIGFVDEVAVSWYVNITKNNRISHTVQPQSISYCISQSIIVRLSFEYRVYGNVNGTVVRTVLSMKQQISKCSTQHNRVSDVSSLKQQIYKCSTWHDIVSAVPSMVQNIPRCSTQHNIVSTVPSTIQKMYKCFTQHDIVSAVPCMIQNIPQYFTQHNIVRAVPTCSMMQKIPNSPAAGTFDLAWSCIENVLMVFGRVDP